MATSVTHALKQTLKSRTFKSVTLFHAQSVVPILNMILGTLDPSVQGVIYFSEDKEQSSIEIWFGKRGNSMLTHFSKTNKKLSKQKITGKPY